MQAHTFTRHLTDDLRMVIEAQVSAHLQRTWQIATIMDKVDEASHPAALLSDGETVGAYTVFVKINQGQSAWDQIQVEVADLQRLTTEADVQTPDVINTVALQDAALVIMKSVQVQPWHPDGWRAYGRALAQIHTVKGPAFGLETNGFWGSLSQDNRPLPTWPDFFWQRRIEPRLQAAVDSGRLPNALHKQVAQIGARLATLCGPPVEPSLLHGDAHQNNIINTATGPVFIDPAVYYGHPEMDLAFVDFFAPVPTELYEGYREVVPIAPDFAERKPLWLLPAWLAMVALDGPQHVDALRAVVAHY